MAKTRVLDASSAQTHPRCQVWHAKYVMRSRYTLDSAGCPKRTLEPIAHPRMSQQAESMSTQHRADRSCARQHEEVRHRGHRRHRDEEEDECRQVHRLRLQEASVQPVERAEWRRQQIVHRHHGVHDGADDEDEGGLNVEGGKGGGRVVWFHCRVASRRGHGAASVESSEN